MQKVLQIKLLTTSRMMYFPTILTKNAPIFQTLHFDSAVNRRKPKYNVSYPLGEELA